MIVRMKKLTLLCLRTEVDPTLEALRDLGCRPGGQHEGACR